MTRGMEALHRALAQGDLGTVRNSLLDLTQEERELLAAEVGDEGLERLYQRARKRRSAKLGRVVLIHGIMGGLLDVVKEGDADRVWVHYWRLAKGRMRDFRLNLDDTPVDPRIRIRVAGLHKTYLPMLLELDSRWNVKPFAYDWRLDIDDSASRLAQVVREWARGEPVHLVAHSMGGVVARRLIYRFGDLWRQMDDPEGHRRGGRLVMLGTPNRGAYIIPLMLSGEEKLVRQLALLDVRHSRRKLLEIIGTFTGGYQMLPKATDVDDDHAELFNVASWGDLPVKAQHLEAAKRFQSDLDDVVDPERFLYVAGHEQKTPFRIRIDRPGKFRYQHTMDGDGRVPHDLGLLPGVATFWVREKHGDLPRNDQVLDGIHALLLDGTSDALDSRRPARRGVAKPTEWIRGSEVETVSPEFKELVPKKRGRTEPAPSKSGVRLESILLGDYLGYPTPGGRRQEPAPRPRGRRGKQTGLKVRVVWGDIRKAEGDVYCVGHYRGVLPQDAELALDQVISGPGAAEDDLVLTDLTRRGVLIGRLGDVNFFPWAGASRPQARPQARRLVAVAGMGHLGEYNESKQRQLARNLAWSVASLPDPQTVCTVLIGAGNGGLDIRAALRGMFAGLGDALAEEDLSSQISEVRLVEYRLLRAHEILRELQSLSSQGLALDLGEEIEEGEGGVIGPELGLALTLAAAAEAYHRADTRESIMALVNRIEDDKRRQAAVDALAALAEKSKRGVQRLALDFYVKVGSEDQEVPRQPTRIAYTRSGSAVRLAAITNAATVPQRDLRADFALITETIERSTDAKPQDARYVAELLEMLLVPNEKEFKGLLTGEVPLVFEVDREMAAVSWEFMLGDPENSAGPFVALQRPVARQLRTSYSPPPMSPRRPHGKLRVLIVGDPGDPEMRQDLPGARQEAQAVAKLLASLLGDQCEITQLIGAPTRSGRGPLVGVDPASRLDVLHRLNKGDFDLVHYCGHGDFDRADPSRVGWVFKGGLITPAEIENMERAPRLIVANACLSALASGTYAGGTSEEDRGGRNLIPSLADEFFRRGVHNFLGTAWEINDDGAVLFAETFYRTLFEGGLKDPAPLGDAVLAARRELYKMEDRYGSLWAAYQHYGDPQLKM